MCLSFRFEYRTRGEEIQTHEPKRGVPLGCRKLFKSGAPESCAIWLVWALIKRRIANVATGVLVHKNARIVWALRIRARGPHMAALAQQERHRNTPTLDCGCQPLGDSRS